MPGQRVLMRRTMAGIGTALAACCLALPTAASPSTEAQATPSDGDKRRVVILNAADPTLPAFVELDSGVREAIARGRAAPTRLHAETLDMYRFPQARIDDDVLSLLHKKYTDLKVDVIVATAEIALRFAQKHRSEIWPGAAIVFHSVPEAELRGTRLEPRTSGIPVRLEFGSTVDLALKLRPATRRLVVIAGTAAPDRTNLALARESLERYAGRLDVEYLVGLTVDRSVAAVRALPSDAAVLFLTMFRDGAGDPVVPRDVLARIAAASSAPVYGAFETYLGEAGIVAGSIATYKDQGRRAGQLVVKVLNGEDPSTIGVQPPAQPRCIADWRQLRRWSIDEGMLPGGCEVRFKEATAWDRYRWEIVTALGVIVVQAALIIALALSRRRLARAQTDLRDEHGRRTKAETLAALLRSRLTRFSRERSLGALATAISHEINQPLIAIQNYAQAARRRLQSDVDDKPKLIELVAKIAGQAQRAGAITERVRSLVGADEPKLVPVALFPLIEEVIDLMRPESLENGCELLCEQTASVPAVLADALQVQLVLVNLLRNAMQSVASGHGPDKRVSVDVHRIDGRQVQVSVSDRGPGVSAERARDIFEALYSGTTGGMGMGLNISMTIIESHGGRLWHEPNPAGGAIFRFTLRIADS